MSPLGPPECPSLVPREFETLHHASLRRFVVNQDERLFPPIPSSTQQEPEELLTSGESAARSLSMQGEPMLAEDDIFEDP